MQIIVFNLFMSLCFSLYVYWICNSWRSILTWGHRFKLKLCHSFPKMNIFSKKLNKFFSVIIFPGQLVWKANRLQEEGWANTFSFCTKKNYISGSGSERRGTGFTEEKLSMKLNSFFFVPNLCLHNTFKMYIRLGQIFRMEKNRLW